MKKAATALALMWIACLPAPICLFSQSSSPVSSHSRELVDRLKNPDPSIRGAAKLELMGTHPLEALPLLVQALNSASGEYQSQLLEVLSAFKDPSKIPTLLRIARPYFSPDSRLEQQLAELGAPAAKALMESVPDDCEGNESASYTSWVGNVLGQMRPSALPVLLAGLRSDNPCKQKAASEGLTTFFCCEEPRQFETPDTQLFLRAVLADNHEISGPVGAWVGSLKPDQVQKFEPVQVVEVLIKAYQGKVSTQTRIEIAKMLAEMPYPRITRFMRAAVRAPSPEIQKIARNYLAENARAETVPEQPAESAVLLNTSKEKIAAADMWGAADIEEGPGTYTPQLAKLLTDADPAVRVAAARNLAELNTRGDTQHPPNPNLDESVPPLLKALKDPTAEVRLEAVKALGMIEFSRETYDAETFPGLFPAIEALLHDPQPEVVAATANALGGIRAAGSAKALLPLVTNPNDQIRMEAVKALGQFDAPEATCPLLAQIDDPNPEIRKAALEGVSGGFRHGERCPGDVDKLLGVLRNPMRSLSALGPLGRLRDPRTVEPLIAALNITTVCPVGETLAEIGDKRAVKPLLAFLPDSCALKALARLPDPSSVPAIAALLSNPKPLVRAQATSSLMGMRQCQLMPEIRRGLSDDSADVRRVSAQAAAQCKDRDSLDLLVKMLPVDVRTAAQALGALGDQRAVEPLIATLRQAKPYEKSSAAEALGQLRDPKAVEPLAVALRYADANHEFQLGEAAVEALGKIASPEAIAALQVVVKNARPTGAAYTPFADKATDALKKLGAPVPARSGKP